MQAYAMEYFDHLGRNWHFIVDFSGHVKATRRDSYAAWEFNSVSDARYYIRNFAY